MNQQISPDDGALDRSAGPVESLVLALIRLAAVPLVLGAVLLMGLIYGLVVIGQVGVVAVRRGRLLVATFQGGGKAAASSR